MASVNKAILVGNVGRDPEVRYSPSGTAVCNLTLATTKKWKDKDGEAKEETEWHRVVLYQRLAEVAGVYVKKGKQIYIEGSLKTRKWTDKDGVDKYTTEIVADQMQLLGGREEPEKPKTHAEMKRGNSAPPPKKGRFDDDDVPF